MTAHQTSGTAPSISDETRAAIKRTLIVSADQPVPISDVVVRRLTTHGDARGTLTELLRSDWADVYGDSMPFAQVYASVTASGVARDVSAWHVHERQTDRFFCLSGQIVIAIADQRERDNEKMILVELSAQEDGPAPILVTVPPRTLHGFVVTSAGPATLLNFPTQLYDATDEGRVPFIDANVQISEGIPFSYQAVLNFYRNAADISG